MPIGRWATPTSPRATTSWVEFHPLFWALQPIVFLYARAVHEVAAVQILLPAVAALVGAVLTWAVATMVLRRDVRKGAVLTSVLLALFFSFGRIVNLADGFFRSTRLWPNLEGMQLTTRTLSLQAAVVSAFTGLIVVAVVRLRRKKPLSGKIPHLMALTAATLLVFSIVQIALGALAVRKPQSPTVPPPVAGQVRRGRSPGHLYHRR